MKYAIILAALALAGCKSNPGPALTSAVIYAYPPAVAEPAEGVYPDCKYGLYAPDLGMGPVCPPPSNRD